MRKFIYEVMAGQFSISFEAPLLGKVGDMVDLYGILDNGEPYIEHSFKIVDIDLENQIIECSES